MGQSENQLIEKSYLYHLSLWLLSACTFIAGIVFAYGHQPLPCVLAWIAMATFYVSTRSKKIALLLPVFFATGYIGLTYQRMQHNYIVTQIENKLLNIEAAIESIEPVQHAMYRYLITAHAEKTYDAQTGKQISVAWRLQCYANFLPAFEIGDTVALEQIGIKQVSRGSFHDYLIKEQIHATVFLKNAHYRIVQHPHFHFQRTCAQYKHALLKRLHLKCSRNAYTLIASIFFGNRNCAKREYKKIKESFHHWGIMHFLARSGLHLVLFVFLLQALLQLLPTPLIFKHVLIILATGIYALFSWPSISFARACATFGWYTVCRIAGFQINVTHIVLLLSCLFLLTNPFLLFSLDFQLSFGLTLILSLTTQLGAIQK